MRRLPLTLAALFLASAVAAPTRADMKDVSHPFVLWTKEDAAAIRKRLATDPVAKDQLAMMERRDSRGAGKGFDCGNPDILDLFKFSVLGDEKAGDRQRRELLKFIGAQPEPLSAEFQKKIQQEPNWQRGMSSWGDRHMRDEPTLQALRYDVLFDTLSPDQRAGVEKAMRAYIDFHLSGHKPWHPDFHYTKAGWLPNMSWPRAIGTHVLAVALKDEKAIDAMFNSVGGFKYFMDDYVSDGRFYNEEFGKYYSNIFTMLLYCEGLHNLGLDQYGWDYQGTDHGHGRASMRSFLKMKFDIGYPRVDIPGGMPSYNEVQMGDAPSSTFGMEGFGNRFLVQGYLPGGTTPGKDGGDQVWGTWTMNGPLVKGLAPIWYEIGQRRFPQDHFDYFLAQMRKPGEAVYLPSLYFGLGPIDPAKVSPPPVKSFLAYERQFAMLKAEESPAYWEGPWPAVAVQFGGYYPHYAHDSFSLLGFYAFNRPIYVNAWGGNVNHYVHPQIKNGPPTGYLARHPWKDTNRGHAGVTVDNLGPRPVNDGEKGLEKHVMRFDATPTMKFVAGKAQDVFPNIKQERDVLLTKEYLFDLFWLTDVAGYRAEDPGPTRRFEWIVAGQGEAQLTGEWKRTSELNGSMLYRPLPWQGKDEQVTAEADKAAAAQPAGYEDKTDGNDLTNVHKLEAGDKPWSAVVLQTCATDPAKSKLGQAFYDRKVGVKVSMLPEKGTTVFTGRPPGATGEVGGAALLVRREGPRTVFTALHEPFEQGQVPATTFRQLDRNDTALAALVERPGQFSDRVCLMYGAVVDQPVTLTLGAGEAVTFVSHAHVRIAGGEVHVSGRPSALTIKVEGSPKFFLNGKETPATVVNGVLTFTSK